MTSSTSTHSTLSGLSEGCVSEAGSSGLLTRNSTEESQEEECPRCAAMKLNTIIAEEALASLSGQLKNLQKELKKTEQVSKINEEQARYIDERRSKLEKLEAERTALYAEFENLRINHDSLKRQYDEVIATARKNQRLIDESAKYRETCKIAMENLMAEKEARQELLSKYLKSVEAAAKINDSMKQVEKKCAQLQAANEKLEPFRYHCPAMLRLLLEFGEIIENNGLMTKSLQKRFSRYKESDDLREYLLRKSRKLQNLSESDIVTVEESSDDDELAKGVEDLLMTISSPPRLKSPKEATSPRKESENAANEKSKSESTKPVKQMRSFEAAQKAHESLLRKQSEQVKTLHASSSEERLETSVHQHKAKTLREKQLSLIEKQKQEALGKGSGNKKAAPEADDMDVCAASTSTTPATELGSKEEPTEYRWQNKDDSKEKITRRGGKLESEQILRKKPELAEEQDEFESTTDISEAEGTLRGSEQKSSCKCNEQLYKWFQFAHLDPLLPELSRPTFLAADEFETSEQRGADDYMNKLFGGPLSPSTSSRRTSISSTEGFVVPEATYRSRSRSEMSGISDAAAAAEQISLFGGSISPSPAPESPSKSALGEGATATSGVSAAPDLVLSETGSSLENVRVESGGKVISQERMPSVARSSEQEITARDPQENKKQQEKDSESVQRPEVPDEMEEAPSLNRAKPALQQISETVSSATRSEYSMTLRPRIKRNRFFTSQSEDEATVSTVRWPKSPRRTVIGELKNNGKKELEEGECLMKQQPESSRTVTGRARISRRRGSKRDEYWEENLVRLPEGKVGAVLEMVNGKTVELTGNPGQGELGKCDENPGAEQQTSLRRSTRRRKRVRMESWSSEGSQELMIDAVESEGGQDVLAAEVEAQERETAKTEAGGTVNDQISSANQKDDNEQILNVAENMDSDSAILPTRSRMRRMPSERSTKVSLKPEMCEIPDSETLVIQNADESQRKAHSPGMQKRRRSTLSSESELRITETAPESSAELNKIKRAEKSAAAENRRPRKQKIIEEEVKKSGGRKGATGQKVESSRTRSEDSKKHKDMSGHFTSKSPPLKIRSLRIELTDSDEEEGGRLQIVTDEIESPSAGTSSESDKNYVLESSKTSEKTSKITATAAKKPPNPVRSEMYKKMHKRLAAQTSCMKELGRVQIYKPGDVKQMESNNNLSPKTVQSKEMKSLVRIEAPVLEMKKVERKRSTAQRKRSAIMLPVEGSLPQRSKVSSAGVSAVQQGTRAQVAIGEAAVLCLFDQALSRSETSYDDKLLEIIQKFRAPDILTMSCDKLADCCVKFINKLDVVGNTWHSVVHAVRYWSDKQAGQPGSGKVLELHQVASAKERNFIEVLHQLSGEEHWGNIVLSFFRKMIASVMKTRLVSVAQHGRNIRCILICARILLQDPSNDEISRSISSLLQHLIERDQSDKVVPMICYAVAIVPEIVDQLLLDQNEHYEPVRRVMAVHLASRDELSTIFNKVIMSRLNKSTYSPTCLLKLSSDAFHNWFADAVNLVVTDSNGLDLESMELSPRLSAAMMTCHALFTFASSRLVPDRETVVISMLDECVRMISGCVADEEEGSDGMFADTTGPHTLHQSKVIKAALSLLLIGRLITSLIRSTECGVLPQIPKMAEEIYRFREIVLRKLEQGDQSVENRLLYFGLNDWLRVIKPSTMYLQVAFMQEKNS